MLRIRFAIAHPSPPAADFYPAVGGSACLAAHAASGYKGGYWCSLIDTSDGRRTLAKVRRCTGRTLRERLDRFHGWAVATRASPTMGSPPHQPPQGGPFVGLGPRPNGLRAHLRYAANFGGASPPKFLSQLFLPPRRSRRQKPIAGRPSARVCQPASPLPNSNPARQGS